MSKKLFTKTAAFIALFTFIFLLSPSLSSAKPAKFDFRLIVKKPVMWISSFLSVFTPIFDHGKGSAPKMTTPDNTLPTIKPLADGVAVKPSKGD